MGGNNRTLILFFVGINLAKSATGRSWKEEGEGLEGGGGGVNRSEVTKFFSICTRHTLASFSSNDAILPVYFQNIASDVVCNHAPLQEMTAEEAAKITDISLCNFQHIHDYYKEKSEQRKAMSKEEKLKIKEQNEKLIEEYGWCNIDSHKERIGNFKIEPPGLFRGRGDHPKQGKIKVGWWVFRVC